MTQPRCGECGCVTDVASPYACRCMVQVKIDLPVDTSPTPVWVPRMTQEEAGRRVESEERPFPPPAWTTREAERWWDWPEHAEACAAVAPGPVAKLAESASAASWRVRVQWAKGSLPHATHGAPGAVKESFAVRAWKTLDIPWHGGEFVRRNFAAVYRGGSWDAVWLWGPGIGWFGLAGREDLNAYLTDPMVPVGWFEGIRARRAEQAKRQKEAAAARPKKARSSEAL